MRDRSSGLHAVNELLEEASEARQLARAAGSTGALRDLERYADQLEAEAEMLMAKA
jgi:hypothetical protein